MFNKTKTSIHIKKKYVGRHKNIERFETTQKKVPKSMQ